MAVDIMDGPDVEREQALELPYSKNPLDKRELNYGLCFDLPS
jgi:hypothetical protein